MSDRVSLSVSPIGALVLAAIAAHGACGSGGGRDGRAPPVTSPAGPGTDATPSDSATAATPATTTSRIVLFVGERLISIEDPGGRVQEFIETARIDRVLLRSIKEDRPLPDQITADLRYEPSVVGDWDTYQFEPNPGGGLIARNPSAPSDPTASDHHDQIAVVVYPDLGLWCAARTFDAAPARPCHSIALHSPSYLAPPPGDARGLRAIDDRHGAYDARHHEPPARDALGTYEVETGLRDWTGDPSRRLPFACAPGTVTSSVSLTDAWASCAEHAADRTTLSVAIVVGRRTTRCPRLRCGSVWCRARWTRAWDRTTTPTPAELRQVEARLLGVCGDFAVQWH